MSFDMHINRKSVNFIKSNLKLYEIKVDQLITNPKPSEMHSKYTAQIQACITNSILH